MKDCLDPSSPLSGFEKCRFWPHESMRFSADLVLTNPARALDGIDLGSDARPVMADWDGDGDMDLVVSRLTICLFSGDAGSASSGSGVWCSQKG